MRDAEPEIGKERRGMPSKESKDWEATWSNFGINKSRLLGLWLIGQTQWSNEALNLWWTDWMVFWETGADEEIEGHARGRLAENRGRTSISTQTEEGRTGPREEEANHLAPPLRVTGLGNIRIAEASARRMRVEGVDFSGWNLLNQGRAQPSKSDKRAVPEPQTTDTNDQTGYSRECNSESRNVPTSEQMPGDGSHKIVHDECAQQKI